MDSLARSLDLANHHGNATCADIKAICAAVLEYGFNGAFVNPVYIGLAKEKLGDKAKVGTVISFPLGQDALAVKQEAAKAALASGADELDIVPNLGRFLEARADKLLAEMKAIVVAVKEARKDAIVKFILETGYMTDEQIAEGAKLVVESGADFVKICSGMGPRGASIHDVEIVRKAVGPDMKIKVAGGIDTRQEAEAFISAGANRIGTSHAVEIVSK
ncbi:deoxyribose-phosphate aldolase [Candidatus Gottesmanbacteria bacterium]|nr:deoxyribose-phosphate aldolase [Candidatus Gottesmanbacteria bacterium]